MTHVIIVRKAKAIQRHNLEAHLDYDT